AQKNQGKMSPEAKEVMKVYDQAAKAAQAKGQTGINQADYSKMLGDMKKAASTDTSAASAIKELDGKKGPISGEDMAKAINKGTKDLDGQAAGKEYKQFADWAQKNQGKLSPEAKEVMKVYDQYAKAAQAKGQTGISQGEYQKMLGDMRKAATSDVSARDAIKELDGKKGPISGEDMAKAIEKGTKDPDAQAAGKEFKQFADWAGKNQDKLSPEAKEVMKVYAKYASAAKAKGQTGIAPGEYTKMVAEMKKAGATDVSAASAIKELNGKPAPISGEDMAAAIEKGTKDTDGQAAGKEFKQFSDWAAKNQDKLSPEAKEVLKVYEGYAKAAQAKGQTGIPQADYDKMVGEMKKVGATDASAAAAIKELDGKQAPISGEDMAKAIEKGTSDADNNAAGKEFKQFADWAAKNQDKLSPEAKEVLKVYEGYAKAAQAKGQTGIAQGDYDKMVGEMKTAGSTDVSAKTALDKLSKGDGQISGEDMTRAIQEGTSDLDNASAGREFAQFAKWAEQNPGRLSPEAKQVLDIYKKYASAAKAQGQTGISQGDYQKMLGEMSQVKTYKDEGAGKALDALNHLTGPIGGQQMLDAIKNGTEDLDGQAAGTELQDILKWVQQNASRLSPEAKKMVLVYAKYATQALVSGQTGISQADYQKMLAEMKNTLAPPPRMMVAG
ncbi:MAG TPA: hypothetical protein VND93_27245, partial [Myxococcales bacterium]|nr:hypothetical protein [Myxococcales bacterium]